MQTLLIIVASLFAAAVITGCVIIAAWTAQEVKEKTKEGEKE